MLDLVNVIDNVIDFSNFELKLLSTNLCKGNVKNQVISTYRAEVIQFLMFGHFLQETDRKF